MWKYTYGLYYFHRHSIGCQRCSVELRMTTSTWRHTVTQKHNGRIRLSLTTTTLQQHHSTPCASYGNTTHWAHSVVHHSAEEQPPLSAPHRAVTKRTPFCGRGPYRSLQQQLPATPPGSAPDGRQICVWIYCQVVEKFDVSQSTASKEILCWLDLTEESMRCHLPWEMIQATCLSVSENMTQKHVIDCSQTPLQKPRNLHLRDESYH